MGRAFEYRKARKFKRWAQMARVFTKIGREIAMSVKEGGTNPEANSRLRIAIQNAKTANMPKENVERAIQKATSKDQEAFKEVVYEGYGPYKVAIVVETATDNINRTVANLRSYFNKAGGAIGTTGSLDFLFERKSYFKINPEGLDLEDLELELIDYGADEIFKDVEEVEEGVEREIAMVYGEFTAFGTLQKAIEERKLEVLGAGFERIPTPDTTKELDADQQAEVYKLLEKIEDDDDVINVFHNMV